MLIYVMRITVHISSIWVSYYYAFSRLSFNLKKSLWYDQGSIYSLQCVLFEIQLLSHLCLHKHRKEPRLRVGLL